MKYVNHPLRGERQWQVEKASVGLQREKLELIYCVMLKKYATERAAVDNFIRGQQRKLREQFKRRHSSSRQITIIFIVYSKLQFLFLLKW